MAFYHKNTKTAAPPSAPVKKPDTPTKEDAPKSTHAILGEDKKSKSELEMGATVNLIKDLKEGEEVKTILDKVYSVIEQSKGKMTLKQISQETGIPHKELKYYLKILSQGDVVEIYYPTNPLKTPEVRLTGKSIKIFDFKEKDLPADKKLLETYTVISDYVVADVKIWSVPFENTAIYQVTSQTISRISSLSY